MAHTSMQCRALYDYTSEYPEDLQFKKGQVIDILGTENADWYIGEYVDTTGCLYTGIFPKNHVEISTDRNNSGIQTEKNDIKNVKDISNDDKNIHEKIHSVDKSNVLSTEESEDKKSIKKSFKEILASFDHPKNSEIQHTTYKHPYTQKPKQCLFNTGVNNTRQTKSYNTIMHEENQFSRNIERDIPQLGSLKDRILALKNIKVDQRESLRGLNTSDNNLTLSCIPEKDTEKNDVLSENVSNEAQQDACYNSPESNKNILYHEPKDLKREENTENNLENNKEEGVEYISNENTDSDIEKELARRAAIRERMARMSYMGMNMHMALGISPHDTKQLKPKSYPKRISFDHDKHQTEAPAFSVPIIPSSPIKRSIKDSQLNCSPDFHSQKVNKEKTDQIDTSEIIEQPLLSLHLSTPQRYSNLVNISKIEASFKDESEDLEKSTPYYTPMPIKESFSAFKKDSGEDSLILNNESISPTFNKQSPENFELLKLPQKPLKKLPSLPDYPYSTDSPELLCTKDISTPKQSTPYKPSKPFFAAKPPFASKYTPPILPRYDNQSYHTSGISPELKFISEKVLENRFSRNNLKDKSEYTYIFEEQSYTNKNNSKEIESPGTETIHYRNNPSVNNSDNHNPNNISPISLTDPYIIQDLTNNTEKTTGNLSRNDISVQINETSFNSYYKSSKYPSYQFQQNYSEEHFSSPSSNISEACRKSHEYQTPTERLPTLNQININELRTTSYSLDQRSICYDPFNQIEYIAQNVNLEEDRLWWTLPNALPSIFQNRKDILLKFFESSHLLKDGSSITTKEIRILFHDYSETHILAIFDRKNPENANLKQTHRPSPIRPNQTQLEIAYEKFGAQIANLANQRFGITIGDGTPFAFIQDIISNIPHALPSTGVRAYGALIYQNRANASTDQRDEIKTGDIISFRNAKFQGHKGSLHTKYTAEVGKPDHVAIIMDWDGTKRKIKAWEQGRNSKKVIQSNFKLGDLKSGEICVWRVMSKSWVNWDS
ncbi:hypothetical protein PCANB_001381 [Pneumocystis canis]|nr:hypothetical protein PCANB_001381 [Pneumocystis canis]